MQETQQRQWDTLRQDTARRLAAAEEAVGAGKLVKAKDTMGAGDSFIACFLVHYLDGIGEAVDFGEGSGSRGTVTAASYKDLLIKTSLYRAAVFSAGQCQRDGSFGFGKVVDLTEEDRKIMNHSKKEQKRVKQERRVL